MSSKILLVTPEHEFGEWFGGRLKREGYLVEVVSGEAEVMEKLKHKRFCLYIIDADMPASTGFGLCKTIRRICKNPIMCVTSYNDDSIVARCLRSGGDSCVTRTVSGNVMFEWVKALLKRSINEEEGSSYLYVTGNLTFDIDCREAFYMNKKLSLTKSEFDILSILVQNAGHVVGRNTMAEMTGRGNMTEVDENTLSVRISRLRDKLREIDGERYFSTVRGVGYRWEKHVEKELKSC